MKCAIALAVCVRRLFFYLQPFLRNTLFLGVPRSQKLRKIYQKQLILGFKVNHGHLDTLMKLVTSSCYDKQPVCSYIQAFSRYARHQWLKTKVYS